MKKAVLIVIFVIQPLRAMERSCAAMTLESVASECDSEKNRVRYYMNQRRDPYAWIHPTPYALSDHILFDWLVRQISTKNSSLLRQPIISAIKQEPEIFKSYLIMQGCRHSDICYHSLRIIQSLLKHVKAARETELEKYRSDFARKRAADPSSF